MTGCTEAADCVFRQNVPATWEAVEDLVERFRRCCQCQAPIEFSSELLLREALTNAVIHGSGGDASRRIECVVRINRRRMLLMVADQGGGFDWHNQRWGVAGPADCSGRGMEIFRRYATHIRFNTKGNVLILRKTFEEAN